MLICLFEYDICSTIDAALLTLNVIHNNSKHIKRLVKEHASEILEIKYNMKYRK